MNVRFWSKIRFNLLYKTNKNNTNTINSLNDESAKKHMRSGIINSIYIK